MPFPENRGLVSGFLEILRERRLLTIEHAHLVAQESVLWLCLPVSIQALDGPLSELATKLFVNLTRRAPCGRGWVADIAGVITAHHLGCMVVRHYINDIEGFPLVISPDFSGELHEVEDTASAAGAATASPRSSNDAVSQMIGH